MQQHHALFAEPDEAGVGGKAQHAAQVGTRRVLDAGQG
jgi:hypothetical protein